LSRFDDRPPTIANAGSSTELSAFRVFEHQRGCLARPAFWRVCSNSRTAPEEACTTPAAKAFSQRFKLPQPVALSHIDGGAWALQ